MDSDISTYWVEIVYTYFLIISLIIDDNFIDPFKGWSLRKINYVLT